MEKLSEKGAEAIAYRAWVTSLNKKGFPRLPYGGSMSEWQLYDYWDKALDEKTKTLYIRYAQRNEI